MKDSKRTFDLIECDLPSDDPFWVKHRFIEPGNYKLWDFSEQHVKDKGYVETYLVQLLESGRWLELMRVIDCESVKWNEEHPESWIRVSLYRQVSHEGVCEWFVKNGIEAPDDLRKKVAFDEVDRPRVVIPSVVINTSQALEVTLSHDGEKRAQAHAGNKSIQEEDTIFCVRPRCYRVGNQEPREVSEKEDNLLQAFLEANGCLTQSYAQVQFGIDGNEMARILRSWKGTKTREPKYQGYFAAAITMPGARGQGGYRVRIRSA